MLRRTLAVVVRALLTRIGGRIWDGRSSDGGVRESRLAPFAADSLAMRGLAIASFLIYAASLFALPQVRDSKYCCEQSSFAAALSNIAYGSRIGGMYTGVFDIFMTHFTEPLPQALERAVAELPPQPPGRWSPTTLDGNGVGYPLIATVAFRLFGFHWWAPVAVMLMLMAASAAAFLRRHPPLLVILYFGGLTVMLFTCLVSDQTLRWQVPVGGVRYFSLVGILPLFHVLLSLTDRRPSRGIAALVVQAAILTVAALVRGNAVTAFGAIALCAVVVARSRQAALGDLLAVGFTSVVLVVVLAHVVSPQWLKTGRFHTIVWTRVTQSLGMNPSLPIAELNKMFPCEKYVPGGIPPRIGDQGGGCIWFAHVIEHDIPIDSLWDKSFGGEFEAAMRSAFFRIATKYPWLTLQTFVYYKPKEVLVSIWHSLRFDLSSDPMLAIVLLAASLGISLFAAATATGASRETAVLLLAALSTLPAYLAAYANPTTTCDLLLCCMIAAGLAGGAVCSRGMKLPLRASPPLLADVSWPQEGPGDASSERPTRT